MLCPLCQAPSTDFHADKRREYCRCPQCWLIFVPPAYLPTVEEEKAEYDRHENGPEDIGYRTFLNRLVQPLCERLDPGGRGLDYGCGPGPTLSIMFEEAGHKMAIHDPIYFPRLGVFDEDYDFIVATEVLEHLHSPRRDLERLWSRLRPGGWLGVMTKRARDLEAFRHWHYKEDRTHVIFFADETFQWLAQHLDADLEFVGNDVALLRKPPRKTP